MHVNHIMKKQRMRIGFIGFGEVAQTLSRRMIEKGGEIIAYDKFPQKVLKKAETLRVPLAKNMKEIAASCPVILCSLWPSAALDIAKNIAPLLSPGRVYCDLNSISPETTSRIDTIISSSGADFVKIAIMAAIPDRGCDVPLLAGGGRSGDVATLLAELGLTIRILGHDPTQPAALKILSGVCLKGVVALAYEMLKGAAEYGIADHVLESVSEAMSKGSFKDVVGGWLASTAIHAKRGAGQMAEVIETLETVGVNPVMSTGTKNILEEIASLKLDVVLEGQISGSLEFIYTGESRRGLTKNKD